MNDLFFTLADHANAQLRGSEVLLVNFAGEVTDFVRFNHARVRQPLTVRQATLTLSLIDGARRDNVTLTLSGDAVPDRSRGDPGEPGPARDPALRPPIPACGLAPRQVSNAGL